MGTSLKSHPRSFPPHASALRPSVSRARATTRRNVAILGFGTVGRSVARILCEQPNPRLRLSQIYVRNIERRRVAWLPSRVRWTENIDDVLSSPEVDIVVELVGGINPALEWVRKALLAGKSVVTANKQLIAHHGLELIELAHKRGCQLLFGASVAGGVPVISGLQDGLAGDRLQRICGILNGTCNYILTRIDADKVSFDSALRKAQKLGFAEADPTDDVDGFDARAKLAILVRLALHSQIHPDEIACRSIKPIDAVDFSYSKQLGCTIRQVSRAELIGDCLFACVQPVLVPLSSPLARVEDSQNLVMATGQFGGQTVFSGHGAGGDPTAVAVVSDLIALSRLGTHQVANHPTPMPMWRKVTTDFTLGHYARFVVRDRPGIIAAIGAIFARYAINIEAVFQKPDYARDKLPFVITLEECSASVLEKALHEIDALEFMVQPTLSLPILA